MSLDNSIELVQEFLNSNTVTEIFDKISDGLGYDHLNEIIWENSQDAVYQQLLLFINNFNNKYFR
jgi:predicted nucleotide-binding protein (sugar kinase/HSP70/actin superfamily)